MERGVKYDSVNELIMTLLCEFAERRKLYTIRPFLELGIRRIPWNTWNTGGIRQNTGLWEVIWNTWKTYSDSRIMTTGWLPEVGKMR